MRKTLVLLLALCLLLAPASVFADADADGNWYLVMMGLTSGTIELNADGTCTVTVPENSEEQILEGSWSQEDGKVSISVNDEALSLIYDGDQLLFDEGDIGALGMEDAGFGGADLSFISGLIQISREPGKLTAEEFAAYQEDGTLPEGKTEEDMAAFEEEMTASMLAMFEGMGFYTEEEPGPALTVLEDNFFVRDAYGWQDGIYLAKVQNDNDIPVYLSNGSLVLLDADNNEVGRAEYLGTTGSCYLEPGEATFVSLMAEVNEGAAVDSYTAELSTSLISYHTPDTGLDVDAAELRVTEEYGTTYYGTAVITNRTESPMANICAVIAVRSSDGKLIDINTQGLYMNELAAGSTITLVNNVDDRAVDYCAGNGTVPEQVEALAWVSGD